MKTSKEQKEVGKVIKGFEFSGEKGFVLEAAREKLLAILKLNENNC